MLHFRSPAVDRDLEPYQRLDAPDTTPLTQFSPCGLAPSALVDTQRGPVPARDLAVGDRVITRDSGFATVRWLGESMTVYDGEDDPEDAPRGPVRIKAGAFGTNSEAGNLVLSAGHKVLLNDPVNDLYFGTDEVLVDIGDLTHIDGIDFVPRSIMRFRHVLLDSHELIRVNGIWAESFAPKMWAIRVAFSQEWDEITEAVPSLRFDGGEASYMSPRVSLNRREAKMLAKRMV